MQRQPSIIIPGQQNGRRKESRLLEEQLQEAVAVGHREIEVIAQGQQGIGGRLWRAGAWPVWIRILGMAGQRVGAMGFPNTTIEVVGPVSDDVGWLNAGATIIVRGQGANGVGNAMAQGKIMVAGNIGARGMTMTKHNPRFAPPELWVLGGVGDFFAEFMAGGIAVICGLDAYNPANVLGHRPAVGMVGGKIFFRGSHSGFSAKDARLVEMTAEEWDWLKAGIKVFLAAIDRPQAEELLTAQKDEWQVLIARPPHEKSGEKRRSLSAFRQEVWDAELGPGGLVGDLLSRADGSLELIARGEMRRYVPFWENEKYLSPCQAHCPTGIPVRKRWDHLRRGQIQEAVDLGLQYTPFPAVICGYLCPNLCMDHCTRKEANLPAVDTKLLGRASLQARINPPALSTGKKIAVIGGGSAGISVAWQLRMKGHEVEIFEARERLGGKITASIPASRIPEEILTQELARISQYLPSVHLGQVMTREGFQRLRERYDAIVVASGATKPRLLSFPGAERAVPALDFLTAAKTGDAFVGEKVVIIGAGNVGCDAASEAYRLGAKQVTLIDIQEPASFGVERKQAEAAGAVFLWPQATRAITEQRVELTDGKILPADTVIIAVGDRPDLTFLPEDIKREGGYLAVDTEFRTSDPLVFAVGDVVRPGLLTEAVGAGRSAAQAIDDLLTGRKSPKKTATVVETKRVKLAYYDPREGAFVDTTACATGCASCGACRDCGLCVALCPEGAIERTEIPTGGYEYQASAERCIGCGFCADGCPCGVWTLKENEPLPV